MERKYYIIIGIVILALSITGFWIFNNKQKVNSGDIGYNQLNGIIERDIIYQPYILNVPDGKETTYYGKKYGNFSGILISSSLETQNTLYPKGHPKENKKDVVIEFQIDYGNEHYSFKGNATLDRYLESSFDLNFSDDRIAIFPTINPNFTWTYSNTYTNEIEEREISDYERINISYRKYTNYIPLTKAMQNAVRNTKFANKDIFLDPILSACGTLASAGVYEQNQSITSGTACLTIGADNVEIDCKGYTITHGTTGAGSGIDNTGGYDNITIRNCKINLAVARTTSPNINYRNGLGSPIMSSLIINNTLNVSVGGTTTRTMDLSGNSTNINFTNNVNYGGIAQVLNFGNHDGNVRRNNTWVTNNIVYGGTVGMQYSVNTIGGLIENNTFYNTGTIATDGVNINVIGNNTIVRNNKIYFGNSTNGIGLSFTTTITGRYQINHQVYNNYIELINYTSTGTYVVDLGTNITSGIVIYNNTFNASRYFINSTTTPLFINWNSTIGNYYTNSSATGYSDTCAVTITDYVCDTPYNLASVNNTDYLPISWKTATTPSTCWTRTSTYLYIPTGCVYNVSTGVVG